MHLKKITVNGFKSFADRVSVDFDKGITGIVGPNGSGKSNVIDAVRWVMGEQNAKYLRGQVATDIIFAGSAKRKALGMAEVTLVFDNREDTGFCPPEYKHEPEVALTRRLYSDGTREYLINKKPCRLKDIVGFFMSTGLGGRSYSMIQQGQVERILNAKPEDIREILEEAAGTLSFKKRRDEATKKLNNTVENLSRIEDIVNELDRQEQTLTGQVEKAKKWQELSERLREDELSLFGHNYKFFHDKQRDLETGIEDKTKTEVELFAEIANLESQQMALQNQLEESDPGLHAITERVAIIREDIARSESTILNANNVLESGTERLDEIQTTIDSDTENLQIIEKQMDEATSELSAAQEKAGSLRELIANFQDEVDAVDESAQVYQNQIDDGEDQLKNIDRLLDGNTIRCESITKDRERISHEVADGKEQKQVLESELAESEQSLTEIKAKAAEVQSGLDEELSRKSQLESAIGERSTKVEGLELERDEAKEEYVTARTRLSSLQELVAEASDVAGSLEKIKDEDPEAASMTYGLLTDFIKFNENTEELSPKAKSAFEKWAERLVVAELDDLNGIVRACQRTDTGTLPVTVLSEMAHFNRETVNSWAAKYDAEPMSRYLGLSEHSDDIAPLLDRMYHLPLLNITSDELAELPIGVVVFTAQGVTLSDRHDFVVGSKIQAGLLSRKAEIDALAIRVREVQEILANRQSELDVLSTSQKNDRLELQEIDQKLSSQNKDVLEVMGELQATQQAHDYKLEMVTTLSGRIEALENKDRDAVTELSDLGQARISLGQERDATEVELDQIRQDSESVAERREEVFRIDQNRKVELAKSEARANALDESFVKTKQQLERIQNQLSARYEEKSRKQQEIDEARDNKVECEGRMKDLLGERERLESELTEKREENAGLLHELRRFDNELKDKRDQLNKLQNQLNKVRLEIEKLHFAIENIREQTEEKYHLEISEFEFEFDPEFKTDTVSRRVSRVRNQIEDMGAINMMAIEEFDTLVERKAFIEAQREEVLSSIAILEEAIEEMEETSKNKFMGIYATINAEFGNLFPILFPGGEARLELTEPDDPLNSGVEIMCRLPGKSHQRMNLFSGGEKALTAISLIFALLKTKPTPFCFLDEVDAPLDEANVGRYNCVLEALSERFQFIVITHNRRTMEVLDTLYGVTMQEPGVSKVVGVDMQKDLPKHLKKAFKEEEEKEEDRAISGPASERPVEGATSL